MDCQKVIVDCDAGTDDALALIILIKAHKQQKIKILGITCVAGNTSIDNVINNVFRTLHFCNALDIPVYKGAHSALLLSNENHGPHGSHGSDGFGDIFTNKIDISKLEKEHAVIALQELTAKYYGEVIILCLAPLTNIALATKMYPDFVNSVNKFLIMGGTLCANADKIDFNFSYDSDSVHILLLNASKKLWFLPLDTCLKSTITYDWRENIFGKINLPVVNFINAIEKKTLEFKKTIRPHYTPCDALVAGILLKPEIVKNEKLHHVNIELNKKETKGKLIIDPCKNMENQLNAHIIYDINFEMFQNILLSSVDCFE